MSLPEGFFGPPRPQPAIPQTEDDYLAALFQLDQEQAAQPPDPTFSGGATPGFLERFGTALQGGVPQAPGAVGSFISGLAGSLAGQGQKVAAQRAQFEQTMESRRRERDAQNLEATREKRRTLLAGLNETRSETRRLEREAKDRQDKFHLVTDADVKAVPGLARFKGTEVPIDWVKPETASDAAKKAPKPLGTTERQQIIDDNNVVRQTDIIDKTFDPKYVGPSAELFNPSWVNNPDRAAFASDLADFVNAAIHTLYGGNLTPAEIERQRPQFPSMTDTPENFKAKLNRARARLRAKAEERRKTYADSGLDMSNLAEIPPMESEPETPARPPLRTFRKGGR